MSETAALRPHRPVLMIGMGGTGKQVLLNLRRMFVDHYNVPVLPHIGHIWIDTDASSATLDGQDIEANFLLKEVDFDATERVNTELRPADLQNYYDHKSEYPYIFSWFDPSLEKHGKIERGAGGIRSFGRLAFFHYYRDIMERVRDKLTDIRDASRQASVLSRHGMRVDATSVDAWLVFSVAGGTGSGMFLDMAFALKDYAPYVNLRGVILLPSVFGSDYEERYFGNAYAALMELEHYNLSKRDSGDGPDPHRFPIAWTREQYQAGQTTQGPVFDTTYLIGNRPRGSGGTVALRDKNTLCEMLAETLFVEYGGRIDALATDWGSKRSNFADNLTGVVRYEYSGKGGRTFHEEFSCRYASLGLSKLHIPVQRVAALVRHQLAIDLVSYWLRPAEIPSNLDDQIAREILPRLRMSEQGRKGGFYRDLNGAGQEHTLDSVLDTLLATKRPDFLQAASHPDAGERMRTWLTDEIAVRQLDTSNPDTNRHGALSRLIHQQYSEALYKKVAAELDAVVRELVSSPAQRIDYAREVLRRVSALLDRQRQDFESQADRARTRSEAAMRDFSERVAWLATCSGQFTRRVVVDVAFEFAEEWARAKLRAQILGAAAKVSARLADLIGRGTVSRDAKGKEEVVETGLLKQLGDLQRQLERELRDALQLRLEALRKSPPSAINQSLYEEHDFRDFYVDGEGRRIDESVLADCDRRFFEDAEPGQSQSLWDLRQDLASKGGRRVMGRLLEYSRAATAHLDGRTLNVVERLAEQARADSTQYAATVQRLLDFGQPWLAPPTHFVNAGVSMRNVTERVTVALSSVTDSHMLADFRGTLDRKWTKPLSYVESTPDRVYVSSEMAGLPLMAIPDLDRYRNQSYFPLLQKGLTLHTDIHFDKFQDLLLKERDEVEAYQTALEVLGTAILAGVVQGRIGSVPGRRQGVVEFVFEDRSGFFKEEQPLGVFSLAVRRLCNDSFAGLRDAIRQRTAARLNELDDEQLARWIYLLHHQARHNPVGHAGLSAVLLALAKEEQERNPPLVPLATRAGETLNHWSEENPPGSGFRCLPIEQKVLV